MKGLITLNRLDIIKNALLSVSPNVYHYTAGETPNPPFVVWTEDSQNIFHSNNGHGETADQGTVDLYTRHENDPLRQAIPAALAAIGCSWYKNSTQYEQDTGLIHDEWVFEV